MLVGKEDVGRIRRDMLFGTVPCGKGGWDILAAGKV
jgi:hypothetical protein